MGHGGRENYDREDYETKTPARTRLGRGEVRRTGSKSGDDPFFEHKAAVPQEGALARLDNECFLCAPTDDRR